MSRARGKTKILEGVGRATSALESTKLTRGLSIIIPEDRPQSESIWKKVRAWKNDNPEPLDPSKPVSKMFFPEHPDVGYVCDAIKKSAFDVAFEVLYSADMSQNDIPLALAHAVWKRNELLIQRKYITNSYLKGIQLCYKILNQTYSCLMQHHEKNIKETMAKIIHNHECEATPFYLTIKYADKELFEYFNDNYFIYDYDVEVKRGKYSLLHLVAAEDRNQYLWPLFNKGVRPINHDEYTRYGYSLCLHTALHYAALKKSEDIAMGLVMKGASIWDIYHKDGQKYLPYEIAGYKSNLYVKLHPKSVEILDLIISFLEQVRSDPSHSEIIKKPTSEYIYQQFLSVDENAWVKYYSSLNLDALEKMQMIIYKLSRFITIPEHINKIMEYEYSESASEDYTPFSIDSTGAVVSYATDEDYDASGESWTPGVHDSGYLL